MRGKLPMSIFGTSLFLGRRTESLHPRSLHQYISLCSGDLTRLWKITILNEKTHSKWPCSIAMLNYQKVYQSIHIYIYIWYIFSSYHTSTGAFTGRIPGYWWPMRPASCFSRMMARCCGSSISALWVCCIFLRQTEGVLRWFR